MSDSIVIAFELAVAGWVIGDPILSGFMVLTDGASKDFLVYSRFLMLLFNVISYCSSDYLSFPSFSNFSFKDVNYYYWTKFKFLSIYSCLSNSPIKSVYSCSSFTSTLLESLE